MVAIENNQLIDIRIEDMLDDGRAFGRCEGCAVFVSGGAVPGDIVRAEITKAKKASAEAVLTEIITPSADRITAACPYFGECGGCTLQELSYEAQKRLKTEQLREKLKRLGGIEDPKVNDMIGADTLKYYRNKATFAVGPHGEVGFLKARSHHVMDIDDCLLQTDAAMVCAEALRAFLKESGVRCIKQMIVRTAFGTGEVMVAFELADDSEGAKNSGKTKGKNDRHTGESRRGSNEPEIPKLEKLTEMLDDAVYSLNEPGAGSPENHLEWSLESVAVIRRGKCRIIAGKPTITEEIIKDSGSAIRYEISPQSFFQVNPEQMVRLYDKAAEYALGAASGIQLSDNSGSLFSDASGSTITILDLYCGAGTIGIWLLDRLRREEPELYERTRVIGIESVKPAVIDANRNSVINDIISTRYICGKAEEELPGMMGLSKLYKWNEVNERVERKPEIRIRSAVENPHESDGTEIEADGIAAVIIDPPRAGCAESLLDAVLAASPQRIVYVSCDPGTLARDIKYLDARGFDFIEATPVDMFPWTSSIEVVAKLSQQKPDDVIEVDIDLHGRTHKGRIVKKCNPL